MPGILLVANYHYEYRNTAVPRIWSEPASPPPAPWSRPDAAREAICDFSVVVSGPTIAPFTSRVVNISRSGLLLETAGCLQVGDVVSIALPDQRPTLCSVARLSRTGGAGIKFTSQRAANDCWY